MEGESVSGAPEWVLLLIVPVLAWSAMFLLAWALSAVIAAYHYFLPEQLRNRETRHGA